MNICFFCKETKPCSKHTAPLAGQPKNFIVKTFHNCLAAPLPLFYQTKIMSENDALTALRSAVTNLDQYEKLALATYLTGTSNPKFQGLIIPDMDKLTAQLAEACELSAIFPTATRIFFAIELLELQIDRDEFEEEDEPNPNDYEGEEHHSSDIPFFGGYSSDVDIDARCTAISWRDVTLGKLIQFPRKNPYRKWSPEEILSIKEPSETRTLVRQERSRIATTKAIASTADKRASKRAKRKKAIADILDTGQQWTITVLMRLVGDRTGEKVSRTTVTELLKELEAEGCAYNTHQFWKSTQGFNK